MTVSRVSALAVLLAVITAMTVAFGADAQNTRVANIDLPADMYRYITTQDSSIFSAGVAGIQNTGEGMFNSTSTSMYGTSNPVAQAVGNTTKPPTRSTSTSRMNNLPEMLVAIAFAKIAAQGKMPFVRSQPIPTAYLPTMSGTFANPSYASVSITLDMLMYHTSTLTEYGFDTLGLGHAPVTVPTLDSFLQQFFAQADAVKWNSGNTPGTSSSFNYSRTNIAVATYVLGKVLEGDVTITGRVAYTPMQYIQGYIIAPAGMTSTFVLDLNGNPPAPSYPDPTVNARNMSAFNCTAIAEINATGTGKRLVFPTHAVYTAAYMYYSTPEDIATLMYEIFLSGKNSEVVTYLTSQPLSLAVVSSTLAPSYYSSRTFGFYIINTDYICSQVIATGTTIYCEFDSASTGPVVGVIANGVSNQMSVMCSAQSCVSTAMSYNSAPSSTPTQSPIPSMLLTGATLYSACGVPPTTVYHRQGGSLYGLYVFLGVFCTLIVAVVLAYAADYMIQPAPLTQKTQHQAPRPFTRSATSNINERRSESQSSEYPSGGAENAGGEYYGEEAGYTGANAAKTESQAPRGQQNDYREDPGMRTPDQYRDAPAYEERGISPPPLRRIDAYDD